MDVDISAETILMNLLTRYDRIEMKIEKGKQKDVFNSLARICHNLASHMREINGIGYHLACSQLANTIYSNSILFKREKTDERDVLTGGRCKDMFTKGCVDNIVNASWGHNNMRPPVKQSRH